MTDSDPRRDADLAALGFDFILQASGAPGLMAPALAVGGPVVEELRRARSVAFRTAEQLSGLSREELGDLLGASRGAVRATIAFLIAVGEAGDDQILRMVGAVLGGAYRAAARDHEAPLREEELILRALRALTPEHVLLLVAMRETPDLLPAELQKTSGVSARMMRSLMAYLELHGLAEVEPTWQGGGRWSLSEIGQLVLQAADEVASR